MYNTRYYAAVIVELFEDLLINNDITIPCPEGDQNYLNKAVPIHGPVYSDMLDSVERIIVQMLICNGVPRRDILDRTSPEFKKDYPKVKEEKHNASY